VRVTVPRKCDGLTGRIESNLKGGKQSSDLGRDKLEYGVSITDGECGAGAGAVSMR
jgi:3-deoxy-D-arabino-heptulosonate 7-phosphate (DAHP) synthase